MTLYINTKTIYVRTTTPSIGDADMDDGGNRIPLLEDDMGEGGKEVINPNLTDDELRKEQSSIRREWQARLQEDARVNRQKLVREMRDRFYPSPEFKPFK